MADRFDNKLENNELSDSNERLSEQEKIEAWLHELEHKTNNVIIDRIYEVNTDLAQREGLASISDLKHEVREHQQHSETLSEQSDNIQDAKRIVKKAEKVLPSAILTPDIKQTIEQNSEDPMSIAGRRESFQNVQSFTNTVAQESWFFGRLVSYLS